jgi:hypothetical protein
MNTGGIYPLPIYILEVQIIPSYTITSHILLGHNNLISNVNKANTAAIAEN